MILYDICPACQARVSVSSSAPTPQDLERHCGERLDLTCDGCQTSFTGEAMRTRARISPTKVLFGIGLSVVLVSMLWNLGWIATFTAVPAFAVVATEQRAVQGYNSLSRRRYG